jgi:hypothetical protein
MAKSASSEREFAWVGRELCKLLQDAPGSEVKEVFAILQRNGKVGGLINALIDCGVTTVQKEKREATPAQLAALAKARAAKAEPDETDNPLLDDLI